VSDRCLGELAGVYARKVLIDRPSVHESFARYRRDCGRIALVHVGNAIDVGIVDGVVVVNVGDLRDVHACVGDIDVIHVDAAHAVWGNIDLTGREREPGDAFTHADGEMESSAAHERDQRGSVDRPDEYGPGYPAPAFIDVGPPSIVEGSESPGLVFDPGPSPGRNPDPVTVTVRSPVGCDPHRTPHRTVTGDVVPASVFVEILVPRHLG
jgi:hypothetical protein